MVAEMAEAASLPRRALAAPGAGSRDGQREAIDAPVNRRARLLVAQRAGGARASSASSPRACRAPAAVGRRRSSRRCLR